MEEVEIKVAWDPHDANPRILEETGETYKPIRWQNLRLYERINDEQYNPGAFIIIPITYDQNDFSRPNEYSYIRPFPDNTVTRLSIVMKAFVADMESKDYSNEASVVIDLTAMTPINDLKALYNEDWKSISLSWSDKDERTVKWKIYQSVGPVLNWQETGEVLKTEGEGFVINSISAPIGEITTYNFSVVSFSQYDNLLSAYSNIATVSVDKREVDSVMNVRILNA